MLNWLFTLFLFFGLPAFAQQSSPKTYAVIAGISSYASKGIPSLRFANKDAEAFYNYLRTDNNVPEDHIKLLVNEEATTASVYSALSWLSEVAAKDDLVYFYFSGHGDMENETIYKLGFLLTYNTPRTNYINNAIRIEDLNNLANTLSLRNKAKVIIITDACHSGNLAGSDFRSSSLVGKSLTILAANEIRIASCRPDQKSLEDEGWGGGRGVFSFHLVNGLTGFAAKPNADVITVRDLRRYLDSSLSTDLILKREKHQQNAVITGPDIFPLAKKNMGRMARMNAEGANQVIAVSLQVPEENETADMALDKFSDWLKKQKLDSGYNYHSLSQAPVQQITASWLNMCKLNVLGALSEAGEKKDELDKVLSRINLLVEEMETDSNLRSQADRILVVAIHNFAQKSINAYLEGDAAELERRRYYNAGLKDYDIYPPMYDVALKLTDPDDFLYQVLKVNKYYFGGLALMLKIPLTDKPQGLIDSALQLVQKALALEDQAAYIYNALGVLHFYKADFKMADSMYKTAIKITPQWALPYNNLLALQLSQNNTIEAEKMYYEAGNKANTLPDFFANAGLLWEMKGDYLLGEELQRKSIALNSRHYLPFERLAGIYTHTTNYALADSFYFEADVRKRGYHFKKFKQLFEVAPAGYVLSPEAPCPFDTNRIDKKDVAGYFAWGMLYFRQMNFEAAASKLQHVIQLDPNHPLAFFYLGKMRFDRKDWAETEVLLKFALQNMLDETKAMAYQDSLLLKSKYREASNCFRLLFQRTWVPATHPHAFLGTAYRNWHHYTKAEEQFRKLVALLPADFAANKVLWLLLEEAGKYQDAEAQIKMFASQDTWLANDELNGFYKRMLQRYPASVEWYLKGGVFLYNLVRQQPEEFESDRKSIFPDKTEPEPVLQPIVVTKAQELSAALVGTQETVLFEPDVSHPYSDAIIYLKKADSLTGANPMLTADLNDKLGDLYLWQGVPSYAAIHYQVSVDANPENSGVRIKLIDTYHTTYQFSEAVKNLFYLRDRNEINFEKMMLYADYSMRQSKFLRADSLVRQARNIYPYPHKIILDLEAKNLLLQKQADKAIAAYERLLRTDASNAAAMYSISRMYALKKNNSQTMLWLEKAYQHGFNYKWVLDNDLLMASVRQTTDWKNFMAAKQFLQYPEPTNTFPGTVTE